MDTIFITAGMFLMILVSLFLLLVVLMQRANTNAGLGSAFGGGVTESAFGTETGNILTKATQIGALVFFLLSLGLYLLILNRFSEHAEADAGLPTFEQSAESGILSQEAVDAAAIAPESDETIRVGTENVPTTQDANTEGAEQVAEPETSPEPAPQQ